MRIVVRFDDICPTMDWEQWARAKAVLDQYGVKPLIGVIPDCRDPDLQIDEPRPDFWAYIRALQQEGYAIAMHGHQHVYGPKHKGMVSGGLNTEFAGVPYEEQFRKIAEAKAILQSHGIETDIFCAPSHSYDENTLKALAANGFKYLSDGKSAKPYVQEGIMCIPCRSGGVPHMRDKTADYTAVFHTHEWVREDKKAGYTHLEQLCRNHKDEIVSFYEYEQITPGPLAIQKLNEKAYLLKQYWIWPVLTFVKHRIVKRNKRG